MKCLQFTIPVPHNKSIVAEKVKLPHHYPHLHRHNEVQITHIKKGEGVLIAGNNMQAYSAGDIFLIGANLPHVFKSNPEYCDPKESSGIEALSIFFNPQGLLAPLLDMPEMNATQQFLQQYKNGIKVPATISNQIADNIDQLELASGPEQLIQFLNLMKKFTNIKSKMEPLSTFDDLPGITEHEGIRVGNIYNYIMQHFDQEITLEDVAQIAYMTPESFCRYFKKYTGHTFIAFLNQVRVNEACKQLLLHKYDSINVIAYKCGFKSITNFNRVFKTLMGSSPRTYLDMYNSKIVRFSQAS